MGHFAKVLNGKVINVIVAESDFFDTFVDETAGSWIQTSYNTHNGVHALGGTPLRQNYAGIGYNYDAKADVFYPPQPYNSWTLNNADWIWEPPVEHPNDGELYVWNEDGLRWDAIVVSEE